ncbi:MAG: aminodeoxychorismate/anthranilate synthase component II, partial [Chryseobacterium sp.]
MTNITKPTTDNQQPSTKILVFDNYDSFTYNLVQMIEKIMNQKVDVFRNDEISLEEIEKYDKIILSPGPGIPEEAGILLDLIKKYAPTKSILGVCLGQQAIAEAFGGNLINLSEIFHGVAT